MDEYELIPIKELIAKVREAEASDPVWTLPRLRLDALFVYFGYAVASVHMQEENIQKMAGGQQKNFATQAEYGDCLNKIYSSGITAYSNLRTCLHFSKSIIDDIPKEKLSPEFEAFRSRHYIDWAKELIDNRNTVAAHPNNPGGIVWKPNMWSDDGRIGFNAINLGNISLSRKVTLHPRVDLNHLRAYLGGLPDHLSESWGMVNPQKEAG